MHTMAAASEQMEASIKEIAQNANHAATVAANAVDVAQRTTATVAKLAAARVRPPSTARRSASSPTHSKRTWPVRSAAARGDDVPGYVVQHLGDRGGV